MMNNLISNIVKFELKCRRQSLRRVACKPLELILKLEFRGENNYEL